jgi:HK97 family phage prohead protease
VSETRAALAEVRATTVKGQPGVTLQAITAGGPDSYGSVWNPHAFDASLAVRRPPLVWQHQSAEPLGRCVDYRTSDNGPQLDFLFSDLEAVPTARRAYTQVKDGTISECSVGFSGTVRRSLTAAEKAAYPGGVEYIEKANLDELSLVTIGAVKGAKVLAVRAGASIRAEIERDYRAGELSFRQYRQAIALEDELDAALRIVDDALSGYPRYR